MRMVSRTLVAVGLVFTLVHEAQAASVLFSPPNNFVDASLTCVISNVEKKDVRALANIYENISGSFFLLPAN